MSTHSRGSGAVGANQRQHQVDPTRTKTLRRRFEQDLGSRFRRLKGLIRSTIGYENDAFGLSANSDPTEYRILPEDQYAPSLVLNANSSDPYSYVDIGYLVADDGTQLTDDNGVRYKVWKLTRVTKRHYDRFHDEFGTGLSANAEPVEVFDFPTDPQKERAFMRWLNGALDDEIVEVTDFTGIRRGRHYTAKYVRSSYARAIKDAGTELREQGLDAPVMDVETMFNLPIHESSLRRLYTRTYENLDDITEPTARAIRQELTQGFVEGVNPNRMASRINDRVDAIGLNRARTLARTEIIATHSTGTLDRYERMGVRMVTIEAEWLTAGDERVCPICASLEGRTWTIQEARTGTITLEEGDIQEFVPDGRSASSFTGQFPVRPPAHPSCRCAFSPVVVSANAVVANADLVASPGVRALTN